MTVKNPTHFSGGSMSTKRVFCKFARIDGYKLQEIGDMININHSAVLHHLKNFDNEYNYNPAFRNAFNQILIKIYKLNQ